MFGKLLTINVTNNFPISLENTSIPLAAVAYEPLAGAVVGGLSDLIGCLLVGYSINPIITAGTVTIGILAKLLGKFLLRSGS